MCPASLLSAEAYVESHIEPNSFPPTAVFDASQNDYQIAISDIAAGGNIQKELSFADKVRDSTFKTGWPASSSERWLSQEVGTNSRSMGRGPRGRQLLSALIFPPKAKKAYFFFF